MKAVEEEYLNHWMKVAIKKAYDSLGLTNDNPSVGCVIVKDNKLLAVAATSDNGRPHAEINALEMIKDKNDLYGADMFVTLEPCFHHGQTGPCVEKIIESGVARVIIANLDPNPLVNGKSVEMLKSNNIEVITDIGFKKASKVNRGFFSRITRKRPFIIAKVAITIDGKFAPCNEKQQWLSNDLAKKYSHFLRLKSDAIMLGHNSFKIDQPKLNCRLPGMENKKLLPIIISTNMISGLPRNFYNFYKNKYDDCGDEFFWKEVMTELSLLKVNNLLVEGGEKVITSLINFKLIDELIIVRVPKLWGERGRSFISAINNIITAELVEKINLDDNIIDKYKIIY